jgi:hypothetical protein
VAPPRGTPSARAVTAWPLSCQATRETGAPAPRSPEAGTLLGLRDQTDGAHEILEFVPLPKSAMPVVVSPIVSFSITKPPKYLHRSLLDIPDAQAEHGRLKDMLGALGRLAQRLTKFEKRFLMAAGRSGAPRGHDPSCHENSVACRG